MCLCAWVFVSLFALVCVCARVYLRLQVSVSVSVILCLCLSIRLCARQRASYFRAMLEKEQSQTKRATALPRAHDAERAAEQGRKNGKAHPNREEAVRSAICQFWREWHPRPATSPLRVRGWIACVATRFSTWPAIV